MAAQKEDGRLGSEARASRETREKTSKAKVVLKEGDILSVEGRERHLRAFLLKGWTAAAPRHLLGLVGNAASSEEPTL